MRPSATPRVSRSLASVSDRCRREHQPSYPPPDESDLPVACRRHRSNRSSPFHRKYLRRTCTFRLLCPPTRANCVVPGTTMTEYPYILFNKSPEQMRHLGACGGKAYGRNPPAAPSSRPPRKPSLPPRGHSKPPPKPS